MLYYLNPAVEEWLPNSHNTIHKWVVRQYEAEKLVVRKAIHSAITNIHLTVDLWTSPNTLSILGIIAHYITTSGVLVQSVLAMIEVDGGHSGDNQASVLMDVIEDYDIAPKIGYLVMDNAFNNDTLVEHLEQQLLERHSVIWEPVHHRLRCNGHVINLAVQSFLFKADSEDLSIDNNIDLMETPTEQEMEMWRKKGPLGKLHNIVVYIQRSSQRQAAFKSYSPGGLGLIRDNKTRWNSWYNMLQRALRLRDSLELYLVKVYRENDKDFCK